MINNEILEIINGYLHDTLVCLCQWLKNRLSKLSADYWDRYVIDKLSGMQLDNVIEKNIRELDGLDLSGLLRVAKGNWRELNQSEPLPKEMYQCINAMGNIRNNWAHVHSKLPKDTEILRELNIICRLLGYLDAPASKIDEVKETIVKIKNHMPLEEDNSVLLDENENLKDENEDLKDENEDLKDENEDLIDENMDLKNQNEDLKDENEELRKQVALCVNKL